MEEGETVTILSRKELRKQKLMEYLAAKGKLKQPNPKSYLRDDCQVKKPVTSAPKIKDKENTVPAENVIRENTKVPTGPSQSIKHPDRRAFGVTNKVNAKSSILTGRQKAYRSSAAGDPAKPQLNENPVLTGTYRHLKNQPNTGMQSSGRDSSNLARTAATKPNSRFSSSSNAAFLRPIKTVSVRMSLGPIVKTKTGLIPAVTQPRNSHGQILTHIPATAATTTTGTTSTANKVRSSMLSSVSISKRKTLPNTALNSHVNERTSLSSTARARIKVQDQNRVNSKPLLSKLSSIKSQPNGLKSATISSKFIAAPNKPNKSSVQSTNTSTKPASESQWKKSGQPSKVVSSTYLGPASRRSSRPVSGVMQSAVAILEGKTKTRRETDGKKGHSSANAPQPHTGIDRKGAPVVSQTVPQPARTISLTGQTRDGKTTKVPARVIPQTGGKKLTAVQEERMRKLQEWREARGISYKRPPMPVKPQVRRTVAVSQPFWAAMTEEDQAHSLISAVDRSLADCIKLLGEGCPTDQVKEVLSRLPAVSHKFAKYWICQARLMEQEGNLDVLPMFEEAVGVVLEPVDELRTVVFEILKKKDETQASQEDEKEDQMLSSGSTPENVNNAMMTPKPVRALIWGEKGDSSVVKYKITATPGGPQSLQKEPARVNGQEVRFFTPVRRSVRIERASLRYPASLQDHDLCVASYNDLISEEDNERSEEQAGGETSPSANCTPMYVYRQNEALEDKVFVKLVCDEGV
uniref:cytoskeleton-associated protein 2-like n=1 Tax=Semicossyphus pulcher TaxID=241346 RepID=UPI0037E7C377